MADYAFHEVANLFPLNGVASAEEHLRQAFEWRASGGKAARRESHNPSGRLRMPKRLYFIEAVGLNAIKIGRAVWPEFRLLDLQTASPARLVLLGSLLESQFPEKRAHEQFAHLHKLGEWYRHEAELKAFIADVVQGRETR